MSTSIVEPEKDRKEMKPLFDKTAFVFGKNLFDKGFFE